MDPDVVISRCCCCISADCYCRWEYSQAIATVRMEEKALILKANASFEALTMKAASICYIGKPLLKLLADICLL
jgi:hypothetical protein